MNPLAPGGGLMAGDAIHRRRGALELTVRPDDGGTLAALRYRGVDVVLPPGRVPGFHGVGITVTVGRNAPPAAGAG